MITNNSEELALIRAIQAATEDDAPRWIIADWYDEHDLPERAEYIRLELEIAKHPEQYNKIVSLGEHLQNCQRRTDLRIAHGLKWYKKSHFGDFAIDCMTTAMRVHTYENGMFTHPNYLGATGDWGLGEPRRLAGYLEWVYCRGFMHRLIVGTEVFAKNHESILTHYPISHIQLHGRVPVKREAAGSEFWNVILPNRDIISCRSYKRAVERWLEFFTDARFKKVYPSVKIVEMQQSAYQPEPYSL